MDLTKVPYFVSVLVLYSRRKFRKIHCGNIVIFLTTDSLNQKKVPKLSRAYSEKNFSIMKVIKKKFYDNFHTSIHSHTSQNVPLPNVFKFPGSSRLSYFL